MEKGWPFQQMMLQTNGYPYAKQNWKQNSENTSNPYLASRAKINSKWVINLNVKSKTIKVLEENIGENLHGFELSKDFLVVTPKTQVIK